MLTGITSNNDLLNIAVSATSSFLNVCASTLSSLVKDDILAPVKKKKKRVRLKGTYWTEQQEDAVLAYQDEDDPIKRNKIFEEHLRHQLDQMVESIMYRYNLFTPDLDNKILHQEAVSDMVMKINKFDRNRLGKTGKPVKAYSFFGTCIRHFLSGQKKKVHNEKTKNISVEETEFEKDYSTRFSYELDNSHLDASKMIDEFIRIIDINLSKNSTSKEEIEVGKALKEILLEYRLVIDENFNYKNINKTNLMKLIKTKTTLTNKQVIAGFSKYYRLYSNNMKD